VPRRQKAETVPVTALPAGIDASQPIRVVYERPKPRIAKGILVLLLSGLAGLIIFVMGQTVWGALWRGWVINLLILGIVYFFVL